MVVGVAGIKLSFEVPYGGARPIICLHSETSPSKGVGAVPAIDAVIRFTLYHHDHVYTSLDVPATPGPPASGPLHPGPYTPTLSTPRLLTARQPIVALGLLRPFIVNCQGGSGLIVWVGEGWYDQLAKGNAREK